jgi:RNA polymerase sigma-70 factor (ECF subfamily)
MTVEEYNSCVDEHSDGIYRFILKNIRDKETAMDIVQDTFEKMWRKFREVQYSKAKSYLFTTAYHTMIDVIRREKFQADWDDSMENSLSAGNHYTGLKEILDEGLKRLPEIQRSVLLLRDYEGYSYQEIGEITGLNESQVKVYIFRARGFLKNFIGKPEYVI